MKHGRWGRVCACVYVCVHSGFVRTQEGWERHTKAHTDTRTIWLDICTNERVVVDSAGVPGWGVDISHHKIPPIFKAPVRLEVMVSIPGARLGSSCHHRCIYWQPCFIFCLGRPQNCLRSILCCLETSLLSLAGTLEVPFVPAKGNRPSWFYPPVCNRDLWTAQ